MTRDEGQILRAPRPAVASRREKSERAAAREQQPMKEGEQRASALASRLRPAIGIRLVQVLDGERLVVEGVATASSE